MWQLKKPKPVKLIIGIIATDADACEKAANALQQKFGKIDLLSEIWQFDNTNYYIDELGDSPVRQFVAIEKLIDPGEIADIKHATNKMEEELAQTLDCNLPRPVNLDPGYIETSKLVLATTKNFSHRVYIGQNMWAEVTLMYIKGRWKGFEFTFPDYKSGKYDKFLSKVREKLYNQLKEIK